MTRARVAVLDVPSGLPATCDTPAPGDDRLARFSLNQRTVPALGVEALVEACVQRGVGSVGLWREPVAEHGLAATAALVRDAGLRVSSLCRGGFLTAATPEARSRALDDNRLAVDEAATLGAACLVMVVGGIPEGSRDLPGARRQVADGLAELVPYALERGVRLALEPLHPMYVADRAVLSTLDQALDLAQAHPVEAVGVVVDAYHVWWDPRLDEAVARARGRVASYQVCDWVLPLAADALLSRGMMGDGCIDLDSLSGLVHAAGYDGDVEVEIFNQDLWDADPHQALDTVLRRYVTHSLPAAVPDGRGPGRSAAGG